MNVYYDRWSPFWGKHKAHRTRGTRDRKPANERMILERERERVREPHPPKEHLQRWGIQESQPQKENLDEEGDVEREEGTQRKGE